MEKISTNKRKISMLQGLFVNATEVHVEELKKGTDILGAQKMLAQFVLK
jgi:hypothetical protein